ncbi:oligosaccharide flippase family protein [Clostridium botulinum]|uniref:oligosaccharide flippase family protein n=1 Tax=Clostridium botulinum TaxID=1491 RepID=UPI001C9B2A23|nr:oligosaccharide flippase family protein [Clostridium botulinum]MBY6811421.1 oligosaccharide flippase family protein [Clostridium botulinum]MBY6824828.1 oligosaccharide flippase family protein [Clostridium botulinum]MBY6835234.1 oligosaccharide flippase family protein [Clostridium botulinum]MBY6973747.1 oligosaccharide flippase family protein [Clostridium botulinum]HBJ1651638.1 oligosaccharide flippase family protein [Clostridium botulinum]
MSNLKKNIIYNFTYQLLILILPFITAPYLARTIGANGIGIYSFSQSIILYFTYFSVLGLSNYGNRVIASVQNNYESRSRLFCEIYTMQIITFIISLIAYIIYVKFFSIDKIASWIMGIWFLSSAFDINWFFFGMEQFKLTVIRNAIIKLASVVCIFIFVKDKQDIYIYITIMAVSTLVSQMCLWPYLKKFIYIIKPSWKNIVVHFKPNFVLFIPVIAVSLYKIMDKVMLGYMSTMSEVGYYENAEKIINMVVSLIVAIGTVMLPRMTALVANDNQEESKKYMDNTMIIVLIYVNASMFGLFAIADEFCTIYFGGGFTKTGIIMCYLSSTIIFLGCGNVIRTQFLIPNKKDKIYINSAIIGAILNLIVNMILIPKYSSIGASIGTICAEFSVCAYQLFKVKKEIDLKKYIKYEIVFLGIGIIMWTVIKLCPLINNIYLSLIIHIFLGAIIYTIISLIYLIKVDKNRMIISIFQSYIKK